MHQHHHPADGMVQAISDLVGREVGLVKNCVDITCVAITCVSGMLIKGQIVGIGIGTLFAMIGVGRVISMFHKLFLGKIESVFAPKDR